MRFVSSYPKPDLSKYPKNPSTIGEHIRKKRMDKNMSQSAVGRLFRVSKDCVTNWENGRNAPQINHYPKIISFLGYNPFALEDPSLGNKIFAYRCENGMSAKSFGKLLGINGSTVLDIKQSRCIPLEKTLSKIGAIIQNIQ
ncbi:helix-turn-helix domain-containing protein [Pedobacter sp.]